MEYTDLPPMQPIGAPPLPAADPTPTARNASASEFVDDDAPDLDDDSLEEDGLDSAPDDDEADASAAKEPDDVATLRARLAAAEERARRAEEYEAWFAEQQLAQQQQYNAAYWQNAEADFDRWYTSRVRTIYRDAEDAIAPVAYIAQQMEIVNGQKDQWYRDFYAAQNAAYYQIAVQNALPNYAAEVAEFYGLPREAVRELLQYPPEMMPREGERMKRERDERAKLKRAATQAARKKMRADLDMPLTGDGRVRSDKIERGSDDHYNAIPWTRAAAR